MLRMSNVFSSITLLFESALLGDVNEPLVCVRGAPSRHASMGVTLLFLFMIISILMLLNMIIAIMGREWAFQPASLALLYPQDQQLPAATTAAVTCI